MDRYTKTILTVIAIALISIAAKDVNLFPIAEAQQGWEIDKVARDHISNCGFGQYFTHRLGHSLGHNVHSNAVNLDSFETRDTRRITSGLAVTVEPGIYIPGEFGVRSEIDVFVSDDGPCITTEVQRKVVLIG